jgi:rhamnulokinase
MRVARQPMEAKYFVACDLGAESGRVIAGALADGRVALQEYHRFATGPTVVRGSLRWDLIRFFEELKSGLLAVRAAHPQISGASVDAWGVDYAYFSGSDPLLGLPFHYRDSRNDESYPAFVKVAGRELIFAETGVQFMQINTLYQLYGDVLHRPQLQRIAAGFLGIADYFNFLLSGEAVIERSYASTTQIFNPLTNAWSGALIERLGCPAELFTPVVPSGTRLGMLDPQIAEECGSFPVYATCSHDTGAAVAAVPATGKNWAYLSSGTWSLLGIELEAPLINDACLQGNYTNELGYGGTVRFLRNIVGLWILQEMRRQLRQRGQEIDYARLTAEAESAEPLQSIIFPNDPEFLKPGQMIEKIQDFCRRTGQPVPDSPGALARCILESLALCYADQLSELRERFGCQIEILHVVGGGSQNRVLNQFTANATGIVVAAGPAEATAMGNILIQAAAAGELGSLAEIREIIRRSCRIETFEPDDRFPWLDALRRYQTLKS